MTALPGMNWTAPHDVFIGQITEVDMASAGLSVIRIERLLSPAQIARIEALPKSERSIFIGKLSLNRAHKELSQRITDGIRMRMGQILALNDIGIDRLLSVKRDAVFITGPSPSKLRLPDSTAFAIKSSYTSFAKLGIVEGYAEQRRKIVDVKGLSKDRRHLHANYITRMITDVLALMEQNRLRDAAATLQLFRREYVNLLLPVEFYREFNAASAYLMRVGSASIHCDNIGTEFPLSSIEIAYNVRNVIIPLARSII